MKIILLIDIKNIGHKDEVVDVKDGYAYNYLIPKKLAIPLNNHSQHFLIKKKEKNQKKIDEKLKEALDYQKKMQEITLSFTAKCSPNGDMIGTISHKQIAEKLEKIGILIDKKKILNREQINHFGLTELKILLFKNIVGIVKILVDKIN